MCVDHKVTCVCGENSASFNFRDNILPVGVVRRLYCPLCSGGTDFNSDTMLSDNGWIIEYEMDIVRLMAQKLPRTGAISPEFVFDEGYCAWRGVYPNDHVDSAREREDLLKLAKTDRKRYFNELRSWGIQRMERLAHEGWRRTHEREKSAP